MRQRRLTAARRGRALAVAKLARGGDALEHLDDTQAGNLTGEVDGADH